MSKRERQAVLVSASIGCVVTAAVVVAAGGGAFDRLERDTLDHRFRHANSIEPSDELVIVAIDDRSLEKVGRWPWPRDRQAALVSVPAESGARAILVDLTWLEPEAGRAIERADADILRRKPPPADTATATLRPDEVLARAIESAGDVYLAYHDLAIDLYHSPAFRALVRAVRSGDRDAQTRLAEKIRGRYRGRIHSDEDRWMLRPLELAKLTAALVGDVSLDAAGAAAAAGVEDKALVAVGFARCHDTAVRMLVAEWLNADPRRWEADPDTNVRQLYQRLSGRVLLDDDDNRLSRGLVSAYRELLSYRATVSKPLVSLERVAAVADAVDGIEPVYFPHARAARRACFANFEPDVDGVVRWLPLFEQHDGHLLSQLGFTVGWDALDVDGAQVGVHDERLMLRPRRAGAGPLTIQLDGRHRTLVPWARGSDWRAQFRAVPATQVLRLTELRRNRDVNESGVRRFLRIVFGSEVLPQFNKLAELLDQRGEAAGLAERGNAEMRKFFAGQVADIDRQVQAGEGELRGWLDAQRQRADRGEALPGGITPKIIADVAFFLEQVDRLRSANERIAAQIERQAALLRTIFDGKICLVGYTATSLADFKPIPTHRSAPGVLAHANLLSGMLTGRMVYWLPAWLNGLFAVLLGLAGTAASTWRRPRESVVWVVLLGGAYVGVVYMAFYYGSTWVALVPALAALVLSFGSISVYRYIFVDSERRQLATALGQYTSKEIARQMAENPELCRRAEMREVTAIFTDLRGFTTISERIGAERTQHLLNTCLGTFTEVMLRHEAMVNKFMGDGIFAFWNPVIYPQADHARRACATAIDLVAALDQLKAAQRAAGGDEAYQELYLRVGVATGNAIVGPCGSEQKYDYTCIGDSVNLAARLESANKFYGTALLVGGPAREQAGAGFVFRPLGGVQVKGKTQAVPVFELLGRSGQVDEDLLAYAGQFGEAVAAFQARRWDEAARLFEACLARRPEDKAARRYLEATAVLMASPPGADWVGAIELREK